MAVKKHSLAKLYLVPSLLVTGMVMLLLCIYYFFQYQHAKSLLKNPSQAVKEEGKQIADSIRSAVDIPADEIPTIATVADAGKLSQQPFFATAETGDKVLVFAKARKVILFRPKSGKVINMSILPALSQTTPANQQLAPTAKQEKMRVVVLNGSKVDGLAAKTASTLEEKNDFITVVKKDSAQKNTYRESQVIYMSANAKPYAETLAKQLAVSATSVMPPGEKTEDADIVIIAAR